MNLKELIILGGLGAVALAGIVVSAATKGKKDEPKAAEPQQANSEIKATEPQQANTEITEIKAAEPQTQPQAPVQQPQDLNNIVHPVFRVVDGNNNVIGTTPTFVPVQ